MPAPKSGRGQFFWLAEEDVAAARRILSLLGQESGTLPAREIGKPEKPASISRSRQSIIERAQLSLSLRQRRIEVLGPRFSSDAPFAMLVALFVLEDREPGLGVTRLGIFARLGISTTLRWLDYLLKYGWVTRTGVSGDKRKARITLTDKGRMALERLFSWVNEEGTPVVQEIPPVNSST